MKHTPEKRALILFCLISGIAHICTAISLGGQHTVESSRTVTKHRHHRAQVLVPASSQVVSEQNGAVSTVQVQSAPLPPAAEAPVPANAPDSPPVAAAANCPCGCGQAGCNCGMNATSRSSGTVFRGVKSYGTVYRSAPVVYQTAPVFGSRLFSRSYGVAYSVGNIPQASAQVNVPVYGAAVAPVYQRTVIRVR